MIKDWIQGYQPKSQEEVIAALREIMQEVTLAALSRTDFFENAAFYGGTALRIFYGLNRFSEDLDFSLLKPNKSFSLEPYFQFILDEFSSLGLTVTINEKKKTNRSSIDSAFLKTETIWKEITLKEVIRDTGIQVNRSLKIKLEVDREPPNHFFTEEKLLLRPFSFYVKCYTKPCLFAGKLHALLFRKWKNRVKGRDWFDLEWYVKNQTPLSVDHFLQRASASGDWKKATISKGEIIQLLNEKIELVSMSMVREDVFRFIQDEQSLSLWNTDYFKQLILQMKFE